MCVCVCTCVCARVRARVCVGVCVREREREREHVWCVCVCVQKHRLLSQMLKRRLSNVKMPFLFAYSLKGNLKCIHFSQWAKVNRTFNKTIALRYFGIICCRLQCLILHHSLWSTSFYQNQTFSYYIIRFVFTIMAEHNTHKKLL